MADNQLQKIAGLVQDLSLIGKKTRGMSIEADEWNTLVRVLTEALKIDQAQEETVQSSLDQHFAPLVHEHLGQVSSPWLEPNLQTTLADGGGAGVSTRLVLADMDQKLRGLSAQVAQLTTLTEGMRRQLDGFAVAGADRRKTLRDFDTRFAGVENLRTSVTDLSSQLGSLKTGVNSVLDLRKSLTDAQGKPIDVSSIQQSVTDLQTLRDNLKGIDGNPVRLLDVQLKLKDVSDALGVSGPGGLEGRLTKLSTDLEGRLNTRIDTKAQAVQDAVTTGSAASSDKVRAELTAIVAKSGSDLDQSLTGKVAAAEKRINDGASQKVNDAVTSLRAENLTTVTGLLNQRFADVPEQIKAGATAVATDVAAGLRSELTTTIAAQVQTQTSALGAKLDSKLADSQNQITSLRQEVQVNIKTSVDTASASLKDSIGASVTTQVTQARLSIEATLDARAKSAADAATANLDTRIATTVDGRLSGLSATVDKAVTQSLRNLSTQVSDEVKSQITAVNISSQIQDSTSKTTQQFRSELVQAIADQQARTSTSINDTIKLLRGEISSTGRSATEAAVASASSMVSGLREETTKTIEQKFASTTLRSTSIVLQPIDR